MNSSDNRPNILILEDDNDQMLLLIDFALAEISKLIDDEKTTDEQREILVNIQIVKVTDIDSLQKAVSINKGTLLALLDCNTPDTKDGIAHNQLVKTNHVITGQHKAVDIVTKHLPATPITMISSMNRFRTIVNRFYGSKYNLSINFVPKNDALKIQKNIRYYIRQHLKAVA